MISFLDRIRPVWHWTEWAMLLLAGGMIFTPTGCHAEDAVKIVEGATQVSVTAGDQILARYRFANIPYKPYLEELFTPGGVNILRDAPPDHLHHHGLMFAVALNGVNFWEEQNEPGRQAHIRFSQLAEVGKGIDARAAIGSRVEWRDPRAEDLVAIEDRTIEVGRGDGATQVTWHAQFSVPSGKEKAAFTGSRYYGLGMRFVESMDKGGRFFDADGREAVAGTNDHRSRWCAYTANADGKQVTIAAFDSPGNLRHPAMWYTMDDPFAYLSATLNLDEEPYDLPAGEELDLVYGVYLWDGTPAPETIEAAYQKWTKKVQAGSR